VDCKTLYNVMEDLSAVNASVGLWTSQQL